MRVLFAVGTLHAGGLERYVTRVSKKAIGDNAFVPVVLCLNKKAGIFLQSLLDYRVEVVEAPKNWWKNWAQFEKLVGTIKSLQVDIVHSQFNFSFLQQWLAYKLAGVQKIAFTERNCYPLKGWWRVRRIVQFYFVRWMGASYSANSEQVRAHLSKMLLYPKEKIPVIPNGLAVPENIEKSRETAKKKYGWKNDEFVIGYVARMDVHKGHFYFLETMHHLKRQLESPIKICLVGGGDLLPKIQEKTCALGLDTFTTYTGIIADVETLMPAFDLLCLFSEREGMPNVVIEAMASGVPVMANRVGNVPQLLDEGAGYLNTAVEPIETALSLERILSDRTTLKNTGLRGRDKIAREFGIETTFQILMDYYQSL